VSCPDWHALTPEPHESHESKSAGWSDAVAHFDSGCSLCRRDALKADPALVFRGLRSTSIGSMSPAQEASEVDAVRLAVAAMRTASRVDAVESRSRALHNTAWKRWAVAAGLVMAALSIPADNAWKHRELPLRPAVARSAAVPAALNAGEMDLPTVEGVNRPNARVYHMDGDGLSVVMIVDESLDV
jgi:hypothetical protein